MMLCYLAVRVYRLGARRETKIRIKRFENVELKQLIDDLVEYCKEESDVALERFYLVEVNSEREFRYLKYLLKKLSVSRILISDGIRYETKLREIIKTIGEFCFVEIYSCYSICEELQYAEDVKVSTEVWKEIAKFKSCYYCCIGFQFRDALAYCYLESKPYVCVYGFLKRRLFNIDKITRCRMDEIVNSIDDLKRALGIVSKCFEV